MISLKKYLDAHVFAQLLADLAGLKGQLPCRHKKQSCNSVKLLT